MKIIKTKVFEFNELNEAAKKKAREWMRGSICDDSIWYQGVQDDAKSIGQIFGISNMRILFTGFCSQGDSACFEGSWFASHVKLVKDLKACVPEDNEPKLFDILREFQRIAKLFPEASFVVKHAGYYSHENCTRFTISFGASHDNKVEDELIHTAKEFMSWIYDSLKKEYDYQNSDTQIDETIGANNYTFTETGKRFG
jgi:hypothetical protein